MPSEPKPRTMTPCRIILALFWVASSLRPVDAWINASPSTTTLIAGSRAGSSLSGVLMLRHSPATILYAGFGGGSSNSNTAPQKSKEIKLKPKQQWDRYLGTLKKETAFQVAVKPVDTTEWLEVGAVKSQGSDKTELAVARQRALIAEHAKRLYPLQISPKVAVEWAYAAVSDDGDNKNDWTKVDKSVLENAPDGLEKIIGFEGSPDPSSGYYCVYNEGRLVSSSTESGMKPSQSKQKQKNPSSKKLGS